MKKGGIGGFLILIIIIAVAVGAVIYLNIGGASDTGSSFDFGGFFDRRASEPEPDSEYLKSEDGVSITFTSGNPPNEVYEDTSFMIEAVVRNEGETDIAPAELWLKLSNTKIIGLENEDIDNNGLKDEGETDLNDNGEFDSIIKRNDENIIRAYQSEGQIVPGGLAYFIWPDLKYSENTSTEIPLSFTMTACYPYESKGASLVCVAKDSTKSKVCEPTGEKDIDSSGAPIKIIAFEQTTNGLSDDGFAKVGFKVTIEQKGDGMIYDINNSCKEQLPDEKGKVAIEQIIFADRDFSRQDIIDKNGISCTTDIFELDSEGKATIYCSVDYPIDEDFEDRFRILLSYKHIINENLQVDILPVYTN